MLRHQGRVRFSTRVKGSCQNVFTHPVPLQQRRFATGTAGFGCVLWPLAATSVAASPTPLANKSLATAPTQMTERSDYRNSSDAQLTQLVRNWAQLSPTERRLLLSEIRTRMKQADAQGVSDGEANASQPQANLNRVLAQRTYGRTTQRSRWQRRYRNRDH